MTGDLDCQFVTNRFKFILPVLLVWLRPVARRC